MEWFDKKLSFTDIRGYARKFWQGNVTHRGTHDKVSSKNFILNAFLASSTILKVINRVAINNSKTRFDLFANELSFHLTRVVALRFKTARFVSRLYLLI